MLGSNSVNGNFLKTYKIWEKWDDIGLNSIRFLIMVHVFSGFPRFSGSICCIWWLMPSLVGSPSHVSVFLKRFIQSRSTSNQLSTRYFVAQISDVIYRAFTVYSMYYAHVYKTIFFIFVWKNRVFAPLREQNCTITALVLLLYWTKADYCNKSLDLLNLIWEAYE